ncbi:MAG: SUKH-3 domain-containing protein, partial [Fimbriiglobus sp.]
HPLLQFEEGVAQRLRDAGWNESRQVDVAETTQFLFKHGYQVHPLAAAALRNLGGLEFNLPEGGISWLTFNTAGEAGFVTREGVAMTQGIVGEGLTPIAHGGGYVILLTPSGRAYLLQDDWFCLIGCSTLNGLLHTIFTGDQTGCEDYPLGEKQPDE